MADANAHVCRRQAQRVVEPVANLVYEYFQSGKWVLMSCGTHHGDNLTPITDHIDVA